MGSTRFLFINGVFSPHYDTPSVSSFLQIHPGAYTTSRTHNNALCLLFWERHLRRLANSARILLNSKPELIFESGKSMASLSMQPSHWELMIRSLVNDSMSRVLPVVLSERRSGEELAITVLVSGNSEKRGENYEVDGEKLCRAFDIYVHAGAYAPPAFGIREHGARLALVGRGRDVATAKYSNWARLRKPLEKLRPPLTTELLLSNDGDRILEGCITNFFVVCRRDNNETGGEYSLDYQDTCSFEVQTAPVGDGVLPGVIRELVIEVCSSKGIPLQEVAPSWLKHDTWEEAFVTNSLRVLQHVKTIQVPCSWEALESKTWKEVSWMEKQFEEYPGMITKIIQKEIVEKAALEGFPVSSFM